MGKQNEERDDQREHEEGADDQTLFDHLNEGLGEPAEEETLASREDDGPEGDEAGDADEDPDRKTDGEGTGDQDDAGPDRKEGDGEDKKDSKGDEPAEEKDEGAAQDDLELTEEEKKGLSERAKQRFERLANRVRETDAELQTARQNLDGWHEMVRETRARPEEFAQAIEYMRLLHSDDPEEQRRAFELVEQERTALAKRLGISAPGVDILAEFPDLQQRVKDMELDEQTAAEIAQHRIEKKHASERVQQDREQQGQQQRVRERVQQAASKLNALGKQLQRDDPDYPKKLELMKKHIIPRIRKTLPPEEWAEAFRDNYDMLGELGTEVRPRQPVDTGTRHPAGAGGRVKEPKSMEEAIEQGLTHMDE